MKGGKKTKTWTIFLCWQIRGAQCAILCLRDGRLPASWWRVFPTHPWRRRASEPRCPIRELVGWRRWRWGGGREGRGWRKQHKHQQHFLLVSPSSAASQPWAQNYPDCQQPQQRVPGRFSGEWVEKIVRANLQFGVSDACTVNHLVVIFVISHFYSSVNFLLVRHRPGWGISGRPSLGKCSHHLMPPQLEVQALSLPARKASSPTGLHSPSLGLGLTSTTGSANPVPSTSHAATWISTLGWEAGSEKCSGLWWIMFKGIY